MIGSISVRAAMINSEMLGAVHLFAGLVVGLGWPRLRVRQHSRPWRQLLAASPQRHFSELDVLSSQIYLAGEIGN